MTGAGLAFFAALTFAVCGGLIFLRLQCEKHKETIRKLRAEQRGNHSHSTWDDIIQRNSQNNTEAYAARLFQEQLAMKLEAMEACKAMIRESANNNAPGTWDRSDWR